jgi:uncharacterized protein CbrC (UPF0167 family)
MGHGFSGWQKRDWITDCTDGHRFQKKGHGLPGFSGFQKKNLIERGLGGLSRF